VYGLFNGENGGIIEVKCLMSKHKTLMKNNSILFICLIGATIMACNNPDENTARQPNIILILADDMGYSDIGCFGSEILTPNLDRLAEQGLRMTQLYNAARCCPSRASLLTGLYPHQAGVGDMLQDDGLRGYQNKLNQNCVTLAEVLAGAGYHCMISGKWHLGLEEDAWPMKRGFHKQYASNGTTGHYFGIAKGRDLVIEDTLRQAPGEWIKAGQIEYKLLKNEDGSQWYATDAYTDRAIDYINELRYHDSKMPFFLYLSYTVPHWPLHAFEEDIQKYQGKYMEGWDQIRQERYVRMMEMGIIKPGWKLSEKNQFAKDYDVLDDSTKRHYDRLMAVYAAMIDRMDQNIGKLLSALEQTDDIDNTLIIFLSDNGGCHENIHRGLPGAIPGTPDSFDGYEYSWANASNTPFSWFKHWTHEGGISTPFIAWYPSLIKAGGMDNSATHIIDIMPTLIEIADVEYPKTFQGHEIVPMEGKSLVPLFRGETTELHEILGWEHEGNRAIRKGDWKLVSRYENNAELAWELYHLTDDRTETRNMAAQFPQKVEELEKTYFEWADRIHVVPYQQIQELRSKKRR
jgi:arylsulfatase A-like enzyme